MITSQSLRAKREDLIRQRDNALAVNQQAIGAIALIDHLLTLVPDEMSLGDLASALGADSAEIVEAKEAK